MGKASPAHDHHFADYAASEADVPALVQAAMESIDRAGCSLHLLKVEPSIRKGRAWLVAAYGVKVGDGPSPAGSLREQNSNLAAAPQS